MFSSAYPDIKLGYTSISPSLSGKVNEYLVIFNRLHKVLLELLEKVSGIHNMAANDLLSVVDACNKKKVEVAKGLGSSTSSSIFYFLTECLSQVTNQAKTLKNLQLKLEETVVKPLREVVRSKKEMWKTCFHYADNFSQQICKKDTALQKCYKQYTDAAMKLKPGNTMEKQLQIFHDLHNTYVLKLASVNCMNNIFYTHALPNVIHCIEANHSELNDKYRHVISNMFYIQNDTWEKIVKTDGDLKKALDNFNIVHDFQYFVRSTNENLKDKTPLLVQFTVPKVDEPKAGLFNNLEASFIVNERTRPNLQRRLASLQQQTQQLVDDISAKRSPDNSNGGQADVSPLRGLVEFLSVCDKEANLNVLLKQMELYNEGVINFLGPIPQNLLLENKHTKKESPDSSIGTPLSGESRPHEFIEPRVMKPISCFYCEKLIALIGKGYVCKVCKVSVHKKCATSVKFCEPLIQPPKIPTTPTAPPESIAGSPKATPFRNSMVSVSNLIDIESDEDDYDEFDDGFSEESDNGSDAVPNFSQLRMELSNNFGTKKTNNMEPAKSFDTNIPNNLQKNVDLLSDLLDFSSVTSSQPVYAVLEEEKSTSQTYPTQINSNGFVGLLQPTPLYDQVTQDKEEHGNECLIYSNTSDVFNKEEHGNECSIYSNTSDVFSKPIIPSKPLVPTKSFEKEKSTLNYARPQPKFNRLSFKDKQVSEKPPIISPKPIIAKKPILGIKSNSAQDGLSSIAPAPVKKLFCVSLYDFRGTEENHLSFGAGEKMEIVDKSSDQWWHGSLNGCIGYFPSQYVLEIKEMDVIIRVMYNFDKEDARELNVTEGEIVVLLSEENEWLLVRSRNGEGLIPTTYVDYI